MQPCCFLQASNASRSLFALFCKMCFQGSLDARRKRGLIAGAVFGYAQAVMFWVFALMFFIGAVLVDDGTVEYLDFFTSMFAVIFGAFGVGLVRRRFARTHPYIWYCFEYTAGLCSA